MTPAVATRSAVRERLVSLLGEIAGIPEERISDAATIENELRMQSVEFVELQVAIEEEYGIETDPLQIVELNEFAAIVDYVYDQAVRTPA